MGKIRVIGIGNALAGDDAIGTLAIHALKAKQHNNVDLLEAGLAGLGILDLMNGADTVIFIDAVQSGQQPGAIHRLVIPDDLGLMIQSSWGSGTTSTHAFGLGETLILSHTLGTLPSTTLVYGIELGQTDIGTEVSLKVKGVIEKVVSAIEKDVKTVICTNSHS